MLTKNFKRFGLQKCHGQNPFLMTLDWFLLWDVVFVSKLKRKKKKLVVKQDSIEKCE
jgi:hypothetical protein